jgi:cytochrome P450
VIVLTTHTDAKDAYRQKDLRQALYDDGHRLMDGVIVNLHGQAHLDRRRLENRLFRRDTFTFYERDVIPEIIRTNLAPALAAGQVDLLTLARRTMMTLALDVAGVDREHRDGPAAEAEIDGLYEIMDRLAKASTVGHATGDTSAIIAAGDAALAEFERGPFQRSRARRLDLLAQVDRGEIDADDLPRDVLTTLLRNQDRLDLPPATVLREVAYFPWVGSHSTSNQFVHAMHHIFSWLADPATAAVADRGTLTEDAALRQRFVHESLRLHPASPVSLRIANAEVHLRSGTLIPAGETVAIDLRAANRDPDVFGDDADTFDPVRTLPEGVAPWGLSFGHGLHACLGQELAAGVELPPGDDALEQHLLGSVAVMAGIVLAAGAQPDESRPPRRDPATTRDVFADYWVRFT